MSGVRSLSPTDAAYLAGLFDGEGTLTTSITRKHRRKDGSSIVNIGVILSIVNTSEGVLDWCLSTVGRGLKVKVRSTKNNPRNLPTFRYNVDCKDDLRQLLPQIRPYLRIKQVQAEACLAYLASRSDKRRGSAFSEYEVDKLFELRLANQKSYNKGAREHITYKKQAYTRDEFKQLILSGRDGSIYHSVAWTPEMDSHLGTGIDRVVATRLNLKLSQVQKRRDELGIPPFYSVERTRQSILDLHAKGARYKEIEETLDVSSTTICRVLKAYRESKC